MLVFSRLGGVTMAALLALAACGGSKKGGDPGEPDGCSADQRRCDGLNIKVCADDGEEVIETTCLPSQTCVDGACTESGCTPGTSYCRGAQVLQCDESGNGRSVETCAEGLRCLEAEGIAECSEAACLSEQPMCDGNVATVCAADGSGPEAGGTDCSEMMQSCVGGSCVDEGCTPSSKFCYAGDVYLCGAGGGSDATLLVDCDANQVCDGALGACRPKLCEPMAFGCDGTRVVRCNPYGSGIEQSDVDCAASGEVCVSGECHEQICSPNGTFCEDGDVYRCDANGLKSQFSQDCPPDYYHCREYPGSNNAYCESNQCVPLEALCDGNYVKICTEAGALPPVGMDCGADQYCEYGKCVARECPSFSYFCRDNDIWYCDSFAPYFSQDCPPDTTCREEDGAVSCLPQLCEPSTVACLGNELGTCAADGNALGSVTQDCAAAGNVCSAALACVKQTIDTAGVAEDAAVVSAGDFIGNSFEVHSARRLIELELNLVLAAPRQLRWVIYESVGTDFVARADKVVANQSGTGFISSGPLNHTLKAGRRYLLGVSIEGGGGVVYNDRAPWETRVSFGTLIGQVHSQYSPTLPGYYYSEFAVQLRVSTQLP
jgi:hypothetical protein